VAVEEVAAAAPGIMIIEIRIGPPALALRVPPLPP